MHNVLQIWTFCAHPTLRLPLLGRFTFFFRSSSSLIFSMLFFAHPAAWLSRWKCYKKFKPSTRRKRKSIHKFLRDAPSLTPTASQPYLHLHHTPESHNKSSILIIKEDNFAENALKIDLDETFISNTSLPVFGRIELIRFGRSDDISFRLLDLMRSIANESMTRRRKLQAIHENEKTF